MDAIDRMIINELQEGFPLSPHPFAEAAMRLGLTEDGLINRIARLCNENVLTRFGPSFNAEAMGGGLTLAAIRVPEERFDEVTAIVNSFAEVAHNYAREHTLNMWFVLATERSENIDLVLDSIRTATGLEVYNMPKLKEFFLSMRFDA